MGPEEHDSVHSASTGFSGLDIAGQVEELEKRVAQQVIIWRWSCHIYSVPRLHRIEYLPSLLHRRPCMCNTTCDTTIESPALATCKIVHFLEATDVPSQVGVFCRWSDSYTHIKNAFMTVEHIYLYMVFINAPI